jgi:hypothetical protein
MEEILHIMMDLVAFGLAAVAVLAAVSIALGNVKGLSHPLLRMVFTPVLAILGLWLLFHGIGHMVSG